MSTQMTLGELRESGAPAGAVSSLSRWIENAKSPIVKAKIHAAAAGQGLRQGGESLLMGGLLGAASVHLKTGLDVKKVPIDAVIGGLGLVGGALCAQDDFGADIRNAGAAGLTVFAYRKTQAFLAEKVRSKGQTPGFEVHGDDDEGFVHGDFGAEDPVVAAARFL